MENENWLEHDKINLMICAPSEEKDQHLPSLIRFFDFCLH